MSLLLQTALSGLSFTLSHIYFPTICTWLLSRYVIKAPPITFVAEVILSLATMGLLLPIIIPLVCLNLLIRAAVSVYLKLAHGSSQFLMSGRDSFVSHDEYANSCNHYSLYIIKGRCDLAKIRSKFTKILEEKADDGEVVYDRMKRRLIKRFGYYCWEHMGKTFDINKHVRYLRPEWNSESVCTEEGIFNEIRELYDHPFKGDKPQWEILVVPNFKYNSEDVCLRRNGGGEDGDIQVQDLPRNFFSSSFTEKFGVRRSMVLDDEESMRVEERRERHYGFIVRMHHSIMDGISAGNALQHYLADAPMRLTVDPLCPSHKLPVYQTLLAYAQVLLFGPRTFFRVLLLDETNCFHGPQLTGPKTLSWSKQVSLIHF